MSKAADSDISLGWRHLLWVMAAAALGFAVSALFSGGLQLRRDLFLVPYSLTTTAFLTAYCRWSGIRPRWELARRWEWGLLGAVVSGAFAGSNVLSQPSSPVPQGPALAVSLLWWGVIYGLVDALLLSVMPVIAVRRAGALWGWTQTIPGRIAEGFLALGGSLAVTAAYHLGYPEYRGAALPGPLIGNVVFTLAYLITGSPLAAIGGHVAMHVAAVLHGPESAIQLPPHY